MKTLLLFCATLLAPAAFTPATQTPQSQAPAPETPSPDAPQMACPLYLRGAYLSVPHAGMRPVGSDSTSAETQQEGPRMLHVVAENASGKTIVSFETLADVLLDPGQLTNRPEKRQRIVHKWTGELAPAAQQKLVWKFVPDADVVGVSRITFTKVKFEDGSKWDRVPGDACSFMTFGRMVPAK